jgi:hypothetical protein
MGIYLNCTNKNFKEWLNNNIYVDHSLLIEYTNGLIGKGDKYVCVSRPRRFGKSTDADMLVAYYSKGCDSSELFNNLNISKTNNYQKHLNKYNIIKIDMSAFAENIKKTQNLNLITNEIARDLKRTYDIPEDRITLPQIFDEIYYETQEDFIFIIDEWDSIIRECKNNKEIQKEYLMFLNLLFKGKIYVKFVYMTGILPIRKYGNESVLNMFKEITFIKPKPLESFTGFTEEEVKGLCDKYDMSFDNMKDWYNGYKLDNNLSVYNPRSVICAIEDKEYGNYWTGTQTYKMLKGYLNTEYDLREDVLELLEGKEVTVDVLSFQNNISSFQSKDDVLTLLIHLGYLGYNRENKSVYIPNKEVKDEFIVAIKNSSWGFITKLAKNSQELLEATINMDEEKVSKYLEVIHDDVESKQYNSEYALSAVINIAYIAARDDYTIIQEFPSGKGYADIAYIPKPGIHKPAMVIELKYEQNVKTAIDQIKKKNYPKKLEHCLDNLLLVGINYNKDKEHACIIEKYDPK